MKKELIYNKKYWYIVLTILGMAAFLYACSVKKNKWANRAYHNTTARFNGYYNGDESLREGVANLEKNHIDKYDRLLPVYRFGTVESSKAIYPQMDKAIKKAEIVVSKHSMLIKGKQYNNWVDASFLLRGKARFYKRDYIAALEDLEYVAAVKPVKKRFTFKYEGMVYLARTYNELGQFSEAQSVIDRMKNEKDFPEKLKVKYYEVIADFHLKQGEDTSAIAPLKKVIALTKRKKNQARFIYILAQIEQRRKNYKEASKLFGEVLKSNPTYDMAFNAQLNLARSFDRGSGTSVGIRRRLLKMAKDDKNIDYLDQIYYALGELSERDNNEEQALKDYNTSIRYSRANNTQKGQSYLAIGNIYLSHPEYRPAKAYYDSASTNLDRESPLYKSTQVKQKSLSDLIVNLDIIDMQDSLQMMAKLDTAALRKKINTFLDEKEKKEKEAKALADQQNQSGGGGNQVNINNPFQQQGGSDPGNPSAFVFTNPTLRSQGFSDFKRIWGDRPLEDNWRRSNKQSILPVAKDDTAGIVQEDSALAALKKTDTLAYKAALRKKDYDAIVAGLPKTAEDFEKSDAKILEAYYKAANIYREQLADNLRAIELFEKLLVRYPSNNKYELPAYYQLYRVYQMVGNSTKSDYYKNIILTRFADSDYARIIRDPQAPSNDVVARKDKEKQYTETFNLYKKQYYTEVITKCDAALAKYNEDKEFAPKFAYLRALAIGRTQDVNNFEAALRMVVTNYPLDPVKDQAQHTIDYIKNLRGGSDSTSIGDNSKVNTDALTMFNFQPDSTHVYALVILNKKVKLNDIKTSISDFNTEFFGLLDLKIDSRFLNDTTQMILVKKFNNKDYGTTYFNAIKGDSKALALLGPNDYIQFLITPENLVIVQQQKNINNYRVFFNDKYKPNK